MPVILTFSTLPVCALLLRTRHLKNLPMLKRGALSNISGVNAETQINDRFSVVRSAILCTIHRRPILIPAC
jgi:hypothetical protein